MPRERPEGAAGTTKPTQEVGSSSSQGPEGVGTTKPTQEVGSSSSQGPEGVGTTKPEGSQL